MRTIKNKSIKGQLKVIYYKYRLFLIKWKVFFATVKAWIILTAKLLSFKLDLETYQEGLEIIKIHVNIIYPSSNED